MIKLRMDDSSKNELENRIIEAISILSKKGAKRNYIYFGLSKGKFYGEWNFAETYPDMYLDPTIFTLKLDKVAKKIYVHPWYRMLYSDEVKDFVEEMLIKYHNTAFPPQIRKTKSK